MGTWIVRFAEAGDIAGIKHLFDQNRAELGFVLRPTLEKAIRHNELLVAVEQSQIIGAVHYHHRRDKQTTLYHIAVSSLRRGKGIGTSLIEALGKACVSSGQIRILLKCPVEQSANQFYARLGFQRERIDPGKHRALSVWVVQCENLTTQ